MTAENCVIYDWLSFTTKEDDPLYIVSILGLEHCAWEIAKGARGYRDRMYFNCISIHYNGREDMGVWCELSGQGCRAYESFTTNKGGWDELFFLIRQDRMNITRLDVAYDDHLSLLDIDRIVQDTRHKEYVSKADYWEILESSKGQTIQIGSAQSDVLIRIYDKARERNCEAGEHWVRCELQLRRERAIKFIDLNLPIGEAYCGVLINYLRYVDPDSDSNRWRWPMKDYWGEFLCHAESIKLYTAPGVDYNLDRLKNYVLHQAGNAIDAFIKIRGVDNFLKDIQSRGTCTNPKYDRLVRLYGALKI